MTNHKHSITIDDGALADMWQSLENLNKDSADPIEVVLNDIATAIIGNFILGINVLPKLRVLFPEFEWKFVERKDKEEFVLWQKRLGKEIQASDFFWRAERRQLDQWVIARRKGPGATARRIFGNGSIEKCCEQGQFTEYLRSLTVKEIYDEDELDLRTGLFN